MSDVKEWNLAAWNVTLGGFQISRGAGASGYAPDVAMSTKQVEDDFKEEVGADGTVSVYPTNNQLTEVEINIMQTNSPTNGFLSATRATGVAQGAPVILPLVAKDANGTTIFSAARCWIVRPPDAEYGAAPKPRPWKLKCVPEVNFVGGN